MKVCPQCGKNHSNFRFCSKSCASRYRMTKPVQERGDHHERLESLKSGIEKGLVE